MPSGSRGERSVGRVLSATKGPSPCCSPGPWHSSLVWPGGDKQAVAQVSLA